MQDKFDLNISPDMEEDRIWRQYIKPLLDETSKNITDICHYGFSEMLNNVIEHSEAKEAHIEVEHTNDKIEMAITDDGIGIFNNIKNKLNLEDERHAILELSKGKLTTAPERHTGKGIFFTSRIFDMFFIASLNFKFIHENIEKDDWLIEDQDVSVKGTHVLLRINPKSQKLLKSVFDQYTDNFKFSKTHIPLSLARYGNDNLISRSQAKRVLARIDKFQEVLLDFSGVEFIGQGFADEIFRVFKNAHPDIRLIWTNANEDVEKMIRRVQ